MRERPDQHLTFKVLKVWKIVATMEVALFFLVPIGYFIATKYLSLPMWPLIPLIVIVMIIGFFKIGLIPKLQWKKWRYQIYENEVELMYGVFIVRRVLIPMIRVQHVDTKQGPILRKYRLSSVTISTAATTHEIPGLDEIKADELRDYIAALAREADPDE